MKPHIYFKRYPSGLGFWRVKPGKPHYQQSKREKLHTQMAYAHAQKLNVQEHGLV